LGGIFDKSLTWGFFDELFLEKTLRVARQIHQLPTDSRGALEIQDPHSPGMWPKSYEATLE
jgi:hypothetical protein